MERLKTNVGKKNQHSALGPKLFQWREVRTSKATCSFLAKKPHGYRMLRTLLNRTYHDAYMSGLSCKLSAWGASPVCPKLEKFGLLIAGVQIFRSGCHIWIEARRSKENTWFSVACLLKVETTKNRGITTQFRIAMVQCSVQALAYFFSDSASSTNLFFISYSFP